LSFRTDPDVKKVLDFNLNTPVELTEETKLVDLQMDSLDDLEMVMALEERFDIQVDDRDIEKFGT
jgi:acyl carrier protein